MLLTIGAVLMLTGACAMPWNWGVKDQGKLGGWQFSYTVSFKEDDGTRLVDYEYPRDSKAEVEEAAAVLNRTAAELARQGTDFKATVVFRKPLAVDEFIVFARDTGIMPSGSILRTTMGIMGVPAEFASDARGRTLFGQPKPGGKPIDTDAIARSVDNRHGSLLGVISTDTALDATTYEKVRGDPRVYAVDVMEQVVLDEIRRRHPTAWSKKLQVGRSLLYTAMEETGITPKP